MALNDIHPARAVANAGRKRVRIDWKRGASLMIDGETPAAICTALGIDEDRLWRHLRGSLRFQYLLRQARERRRLLGQLKLETVSREAVVRLARSADKPDAMLIAQLAETAQGEGDGTTQNSDVIARLADSGRRPPNQAFRKRLAVERKQMDAEFSEVKRAMMGHAAAQEVAARRAGLAQARGRPMEPVAQAAGAAEETENKTQISENKPGPSAEKVAVRAETPSQVVAQAVVLPRRVPLPASARRDSTIVDLTDIHGNPIAGVEILDRHARESGHPEYL